MDPENIEPQPEQKSSLFRVTPLSKYLAMALFVILPFVGGYIGYTFAPEKVVEVEKSTANVNSVMEAESIIFDDIASFEVATTTSSSEAGEYLEKRSAEQRPSNTDDELLVASHTAIDSASITKVAYGHPYIAASGCRGFDEIPYDITFESKGVSAVSVDIFPKAEGGPILFTGAYTLEEPSSPSFVKQSVKIPYTAVPASGVFRVTFTDDGSGSMLSSSEVEFLTLPTPLEC